MYDFNNLIADIGGYLGLLMGQSILALYDLGADYVKTCLLWYRKYFRVCRKCHAPSAGASKDML